jgi:peptidoglycan/xylan/chitin deacetylase (PgdA/CDA1 family)
VPEVMHSLIRVTKTRVLKPLIQMILRSPKMQGLLLKLLHSPYTILCYHHISDGTERFPHPLSELVVSTEHLEKQLRFLKKHYEIVTVRELLQRLLQPRPLLRPLLALTFDDGYESVLTQAVPVLGKFELRATVFVNSSVVFESQEVLWPDLIALLARHAPPDQLLEECRKILADTHFQQAKPLLQSDETAPRLIRYVKSLPVSAVFALAQHLQTQLGRFIPEAARPRYLCADQIRILHQKGFEIGGHTLHHPILTQASPELIEREIREDKQQLEALIGEQIISFAYPNGTYNQAVQKVVADQGYKCAVAVEVEQNHQTSIDFFALARRCISNHTARDRQGGFSESLFFIEVAGRRPVFRRGNSLRSP